ncbi:M1 family metallopeptidase [Streptomyces sp. NPDC051907]|uniref:M1 family metallopeptidase n=1 Tax=Streptomyces sp. NPDC051907 TaxID=3155284 RepID=UPI0034182384
MDQRALVRAVAPALALLLLVSSAGCTGGGAGVEGEPGAAGLRDPYFRKLGNGGYDVEHYDLTLDYEPRTGRLTGSAEITARATQDLSAFNLDLHGLTVDGVQVEGREAAANRAGDELTVRPRRDLDKGETFRTVVRYSGVPRTVVDADRSKEGWLATEEGALAVGEPTGSMSWFPGNHHPSDKATYDIAVTVPKPLKAVSNGELESERADGGRTSFVWTSKEPMASYLATLAIGPYDVKSTRTASGLPVVNAVDPELADDSKALLGRVPEVVKWGTENFGPYPFSAAGAIVVPDGDVGYALETQTRPVFPQGQFDLPTLVHEIAHQWYGDSVSPASWRDMWLNEGFATYAEWLWAEDFDDMPAQESFDEAFADEANWEFPPAAPPSAADISSAPVYGRGAMVLHKIRQAVGDDVFREILRGWPAEHRYGNASTADFTEYVEEKSGEDLSEVWDVWLYGDERPDTP